MSKREGWFDPHEMPLPVNIRLSHVWGNMKQLGCSLGKLLKELPITIADSIEFLKLLGKKYLWVDSIRLPDSHLHSLLARLSDLHICHTMT
jgi:Heterokaryon incompatibility protein (HET)